MTILNLTQHNATPDQLASGVVEPTDKAAVQAALTFESLPSSDTLKARAETLAMFALHQGATSAMIGGAPFFMRPLEEALWEVGVRPLYAFSTREVEEQTQEDGSVRKVAVFRHQGFVGMEFAEYEILRKVSLSRAKARDRHADHLRGNDPSISWEEQDAHWRS